MGYRYIAPPCTHLADFLTSCCTILGDTGSCTANNPVHHSRTSSGIFIYLLDNVTIGWCRLSHIVGHTGWEVGGEYCETGVGQESNSVTFRHLCHLLCIHLFHHARNHSDSGCLSLFPCDLECELRSVRVSRGGNGWSRSFVDAHRSRRSCRDGLWLGDSSGRSCGRSSCLSLSRHCLFLSRSDCSGDRTLDCGHRLDKILATRDISCSLADSFLCMS